jgi:hypothetical protein
LAQSPTAPREFAVQIYRTTPDILKLCHDGPSSSVNTVLEMQQNDGPAAVVHDASHNSTTVRVINMSGLRYVDDPLVTVSGQFPLSRCDFSLPKRGESPSGPKTRPFALRWLIDIGVPSAPRSYRYCPIRQVGWETVPDDEY